MDHKVSWDVENWKNKLFFGDNYDVLRKYFPDEIVDFVYLDPPFNSKKQYNVIFKRVDTHSEAEAQIKAFDDTWHWTKDTEETLDKITKHPLASPALVDLVSGFVKALGRNDATAYLVMMTLRLLEIYRVMKPTASIYLHCDPTMSHYLKIIMDQIFGVQNFRNEIIWKRTSAHSDSKRYGRVHDVILFYTKSGEYTWNPIYLPYDEEYIKKNYRYTDSDGRRWMADNLTASGLSGGGYEYEWKGVTRVWRYPKERMEELDREGKIYYPSKGGVPRLKRYLDEQRGLVIQDVITHVKPISSHSKERLGYPTQKPLELLRIFIKASTREGDIVLDPFCGCGTAIDAAQELNRRWIGIDITHIAITLIRHRLRDRYGPDIKETHEIYGEPTTVEDAKKLAQMDRFNFQVWACGLVGAKPIETRGADRGIDGYLYFHDGRTIKKAVVQVKSGQVHVKDIRDLKGVLEREQAPIGILITLEKPTKPMIKEALEAKFYEDPLTGQRYPRIQILTIKEILNKKKMPETPFTSDYHKRAPSHRPTNDPSQLKLL